jgi:hypothetical protein
MNENFEIEEVKTVEKKDSLTTRSIWDSAPTPLEWISNSNGTGPYTPAEPTYFYLGNEPDYKNGNNYTYYAHFYWTTDFPDAPGSRIAKSYMMQIQWRMNFVTPWNYINVPNGYGLVEVFDDGLINDISAYAFPYRDQPCYSFEIRTRLIHKDFINSIPNPDSEYQYKYDRSLVSKWSSIGFAVNYNNFWGYGKPQPQPINNSDNWEGDAEESEGHVLVTINFPNESRYIYSYEIWNISGYNTEIHSNNTTNFLGIGKNKLTQIGSQGGQIEVFATCKDKETGDDYYASQWVYYSSGQVSLNVSFSQKDFFY